MRIHQLTVDAAFASVQSCRGGLSPDEAARRLREFGPNEVPRMAGVSLGRRFLAAFFHFFALILWLAAVLAFVAEHHEPGQGMRLLGFAILGVILVNGAFSFWQEHRAEQAIAALQQLLPCEVRVRRADDTRSVPASQLVPGDVVFLEAGDRVPAEARVVESFGIRVDNATITGESIPHSRNPLASDATELYESTNVVLAGTSVVSGSATALVFATGTQTAVGRIARLTQEGQTPPSPLQREVARLSRLVAGLSLGLGLAFFLVGRALQLPFWSNFVFAIGIIVANVPEGLLPTLTLALAMASQRMARRQALIRHLPAVETLGAATVICTDKTGTLTLNRLAVRRLVLGTDSIEVSPATVLGKLVPEHRHFFETARYCHSLQPTTASGRRDWLGDPIERALHELATRAQPSHPEWPRIAEIPFDSERRRMSTLHETPEGRRLFTKGAPESVIPLCESVELAGEVERLTGAVRARVQAAQDAMASEGLRVLALAYRSGADLDGSEASETALTLAGLVGLEDPPRPEVTDAIQKCRTAGIRVIMVTGDHPQTALAIAHQTGLVRSASPRVLTSEQMRNLSDVQLQLELDAPEILFARAAAGDKLRIVAALQRKHEIVAVTGDGVNDAPALRKADIGISMGIGGTDVARESADMVLLDDNFASIVAAIEEGRAIYANIRKFLTYILTSNVPELVPYLAFVLFRIPLPLTILQILAVDLGTDLLPALALGAEPPDPGTMERRPRPRGERLLNRGLLVRAYLWLGMLQAIAAMSAYFFVLHTGGWVRAAGIAPPELLYRQATTACLAGIVVMQVPNLLCCRSFTESALARRPFQNRLLLVGLGVELLLLALLIYTPWGNALFGTAPLSAATWSFLLPFPIGMLALEEARKAWVRWRCTVVRPSSGPPSDKVAKRDAAD